MKLREARARRLLTAQELAKQAGMSDSTHYHIERGGWSPSLKTVRKLSAVLGVDPMDVEEFKAAIEKASE